MSSNRFEFCFSGLTIGDVLSVNDKNAEEMLVFMDRFLVGDIYDVPWSDMPDLAHEFVESYKEYIKNGSDSSLNDLLRGIDL